MLILEVCRTRVVNNIKPLSCPDFITSIKFFCFSLPFLQSYLLNVDIKVRIREESLFSSYKVECFDYAVIRQNRSLLHVIRTEIEPCADKNTSTCALIIQILCYDTYSKGLFIWRVFVPARRGNPPYQVILGSRALSAFLYKMLRTVYIRIPKVCSDARWPLVKVHSLIIGRKKLRAEPTFFSYKRLNCFGKVWTYSVYVTMGGPSLSWLEETTLLI